MVAISQCLKVQFKELQSARKTIASLKAARLEFEVAQAKLSIRAVDLEEELALEKEQSRKLEGFNAGLKRANEELEARVSSLNAQNV